MWESERENGRRNKIYETTPQAYEITREKVTQDVAIIKLLKWNSTNHNTHSMKRLNSSFNVPNTPVTDTTAITVSITVSVTLTVGHNTAK